MFKSDYRKFACPVFPTYTGVRIMMMPFRTDNVLNTIPITLQQYIPMLLNFSERLDVGVGYLTIDEAYLEAGEHHRRPGLHVDGVDEADGPGGWGGYPTPGKWGSGGFITAATHVGCKVYRTNEYIFPRKNGDCSHIKAEEFESELMQPNVAYFMGPYTLHESVPVKENCKRQFIRVSGPSNGAWYEGYTPNPTGIKPTGEIRPRREFMDYRK